MMHQKGPIRIYMFTLNHIICNFLCIPVVISSGPKHSALETRECKMKSEGEWKGRVLPTLQLFLVSADGFPNIRRVQWMKIRAGCGWRSLFCLHAEKSCCTQLSCSCPRPVLKLAANSCSCSSDDVFCCFQNSTEC